MLNIINMFSDVFEAQHKGPLLKNLDNQSPPGVKVK